MFLFIIFKMFKFALLGCGRIFTRHADILSGNIVNDASLVAVCDIDETKAKHAGKKYNVPYYTDLDQMLLKEDIDIVSILTPSGLHAEHSIKVAKKSKHVIVEKPMALKLDDADKMITECDINGVRLFVVKQNRFNLPIKKLREAIEQGRFGKLVLGTTRVRWCRPQSYYDQDSWRGTWAYDGGVLANQASHHIDLLEWMMGEVESVFAKASTALVKIEAEDTAVVTLKFKNGALGIIEATTATRPKDIEGSISVLGENGTVEIGGFAANEIKIWNFKQELPQDIDIIKNYSVNPPNVYGFGHKEYYENVIYSLKENKAALVDGIEGRKSLELISAIYESIETGKEVYLRFKPNKCKLGERT